MMEPEYKGVGTLDVRDALNLVLLFYTVGQWTEEKKAEWLRITGSTEASTKVLCDHIRAVLDSRVDDLTPLDPSPLDQARLDAGDACMGQIHDLHGKLWRVWMTRKGQVSVEKVGK